ILAAILGGSLSYDQVWEKSDIDMILVGDESHKERSFTLTEEGVIIHASVMPRSAFRKAIEGSIRSSFFHSFFSKSRLLYTHDESLYALYDNIQQVGERDKAAQLLRVVPAVLWALPKAEKWLHIKRDVRYSFLYILLCTGPLAQIEVVSAGRIPTREAIWQALELNPGFFRRIYTDLIDGPKDEPTLRDALSAIEEYLLTRVRRIFQPILSYLAEAGGPRSASEIDAEFKKMLQMEGASGVCEWLSEKGIVEKVPLPLRLSPKSPVAVNEAGYYYDAGE
ncbi:MAG: hypothetical protein SFU56_10315, partial [Capsulimonadales bacterium]|nr:hypothetical protein [Capsulimonadales bacterium]